MLASLFPVSCQVQVSVGAARQKGLQSSLSSLPLMSQVTSSSLGKVPPTPCTGITSVLSCLCMRDLGTYEALLARIWRALSHRAFAFMLPSTVSWSVDVPVWISQRLVGGGLQRWALRSDWPCALSKSVLAVPCLSSSPSHAWKRTPVDVLRGPSRNREKAAVQDPSPTFLIDGGNISLFLVSP